MYSTLPFCNRRKLLHECMHLLIYAQDMQETNDISFLLGRELSDWRTWVRKTWLYIPFYTLCIFPCGSELVYKLTCKWSTWLHWLNFPACSSTLSCHSYTGLLLFLKYYMISCSGGFSKPDLEEEHEFDLLRAWIWPIASLDWSPWRNLQGEGWELVWASVAACYCPWFWISSLLFRMQLILLTQGH